MSKKRKFKNWLGNKSEDFEEKESKDIYEVRKLDSRKFMQTIQQTISTQGCINPMA